MFSIEQWGYSMDINIKIKNKVFYSFEEFAKNIYLYPDEAFHLIKSQKFLKFLYNYNKKMYNKVMLLHNGACYWE